MIYCSCETPVMNIDFDSGCRRCGLPVDFSPKLTPEENLRESKTNLAKWDLEHGRWNPDTHSYEKPCHVCGNHIGARKPRIDVSPTCPRNECQLAASGMISVSEARDRLRKGGYTIK